MIHIKTPVQVCDSEIINLYYVRDADGDRITTKITLEEAREIVATLNEHDDLIAQRDALVGACEMLVLAGDDPDADGFWGRFDLALELAATALALARGEQ